MASEGATCSRPSGNRFSKDDAAKDGGVIATVYARTYTDNISMRGSFTYGVCAAAMASWSNHVTVSF
jgi:hypothetical protein